MGIVDKIKDTLWGAPDKGISGEPDPEELSVDNAYKTRWIWSVSYTHLTLPTNREV